MQPVRNISAFQLSANVLSALLALLFLFSCSKEKDLSAAASENATASGPSISAQASDRTSTVAVPFDWTYYVPCANGGAGEYVHVSGSTNLVYTISWTDHGFTYGYHANTYQIEGVGLSSGETFTGSGHTEGQVMGAWVNEQWLSTMVDQIKLIGTTTSFVVKNTYHITVSPDGTEEIKLRDRDVTCN